MTVFAQFSVAFDSKGCRHILLGVIDLGHFVRPKKIIAQLQMCTRHEKHNNDEMPDLLYFVQVQLHVLGVGKSCIKPAP
jgi:hypothetical protein